MKKFVALALFAAACGSKSDADYKKDVVSDMHSSIAVDLANLSQAARDLKAAAPMPSGRGWDATLDADAIAAMKVAWENARTAYEHVEGATAPIFPDSDVALDARYDDFLTLLPNGDADLFDGTGVTGMHAIERILYADVTPQRVIDFEKTLPGYVVAAFPATEDQATEMVNGLLDQLITDSDTLASEWQPSAIDIGAAFQGLVALMNEQKEKVDKASDGTEESRYSQTTLFDLRNNLDGTKTIYEIFQPWLDTKTGGSADDAMIESGFSTLATLYAADPGDALPQVPTDWSSDMPTTTDLATPFGVLWNSVHMAVDPTTSGSVVFEMNDVADILGFPEFVE